MYSLSRRAIHPKLSLPELTSSHTRTSITPLRTPRFRITTWPKLEARNVPSSFRGKSVSQNSLGRSNDETSNQTYDYDIQVKPGYSIDFYSNQIFHFDSKLEHDHSFVHHFDSVRDLYGEVQSHPQKKLTSEQHRCGEGRNNGGILTIRHRGGGHKRIVKSIFGGIDQIESREKL